MVLRKLTLVLVLVLCMNSLSGCEVKNEGDAIMSKSFNVKKEICDILNGIESEEAAVAAIPRLEELAIEYTQAKKDFISYRKSNPRFAKKYSQEIQSSMLAWGEALAGIHANPNVPKEIRDKIMGILSR